MLAAAAGSGVHTSVHHRPVQVHVAPLESDPLRRPQASRRREHHHRPIARREIRRDCVEFGPPLERALLPPPRRRTPGGRTIYNRIADARVEAMLGLAHALLADNAEHVAACCRIEEPEQ
jgi:hypothetical protein